jgi:hypothetical protein
MFIHIHLISILTVLFLSIYFTQLNYDLYFVKPKWQVLYL